MDTVKLTDSELIHSIEILSKFYDISPERCLEVQVEKAIEAFRLDVPNLDSLFEPVHDEAV